MITKGDKILFAAVGIFVMLTFIFWQDVKSIAGGNTKVSEVKKESGKKDRKEGKKANAGLSEVEILQKWELPPELKEVSGIAYLDEQRFACIQDEEGTIFIFNRVANKIEKKIPFAGPGDFEGITVKGDVAYVIRADGKVYEVHMKVGKNSAKEYSTPLTVEHNVEGLCYDKNNNRLLLAIKEDEPSNPGYKGIYAFDLSTKTMVKEPAFKIKQEDKLIKEAGDKKNKSIMPSEIAIHPVTREIYITDGPQANLLLMDEAGNLRRLVELGKEFPQPEGITFSPRGEIFISNEGTKDPGNIIEIRLK